MTDSDQEDQYQVKTIAREKPKHLLYLTLINASSHLVFAKWKERTLETRSNYVEFKLKGTDSVNALLECKGLSTIFQINLKINLNVSYRSKNYTINFLMFTVKSFSTLKKR